MPGVRFDVEAATTYEVGRQAEGSDLVQKVYDLQAD
jgi:hypothetical protein